jgi:predicted transcriptional regulator YdeE
MNAEIFESGTEIVVVGAPLRTSAQNARTEIPAFWQRVMEGELASRPPRRDDDARLHAAYCDYETDGSGAFTMIVGYEVDADQAVPEGMRRVQIPKGRYARFDVAGDPAQLLWQTWAFINEEWETRSERLYAVDYERYAPESAPSLVRVDVVVGLR